MYLYIICGHSVDVLPLALPGVRHTANNGAEHESSDEGEEHEVDEAFQSVITQSSHGLDKVLEKGETPDQSLHSHI